MEEEKIFFKKMGPDEKSMVTVLMRECLIDEYGVPPEPRNIDDLIEYYHSRPDSVVICLFVDDVFAGFMWTLQNADIITGEKFCFGLYLAVKKEFRRKKYASMIYEETFKFCRENNLKEFKFTVRSDNEPALGLHYAMGAKIQKHEMVIKID